MPGPLQAAGAAPEPTEYAPLTMDRYITGLWTQRSPLRDADVPYIYGKFYSATRFDSLIDGLNREVSAKLTMIRRPGFSVYNSQSFPPIRSFFTYKFMQNGVQQVRMVVDTDTAVYDATPPGKTLLFTKSAGAGRTRFLAIGTELFMTDGVDLKKWVQSNTVWKANTAFSVGTLIIDTNGNIQVATTTTATANIASASRNTSSIGTAFNTLITVNFTTPIQINAGVATTLAGMTVYPDLNGTYSTPRYSITKVGSNAIQIFYHPGVAPTNEPLAAETGTATFAAATGGTSGSTAPTWATAIGATTVDGSLLWTNYGPQVQNWGPPPAPSAAPSILANSDRYWKPSANLGLWYACYDANKNLEVIVGNPGPSTLTGTAQPLWAQSKAGYTYDGGFQWVNCGNIGSWAASNVYTIDSAILDSNGNLQIATTVLAPGQTGTTVPTWATTLGTTTTDNNITWTCAGPGVSLAYGNVSYCYSYHCIDGSVSTASPLATIPNGVLGTNGGYSIPLQGITTNDPQCDQIYLFRTAQGGAIPLFLAAIPNPCIGSICTWTFLDTLPDSALNEFKIAPIANAGDPPPAGATAPNLHLLRAWMIVGSRVIWSGGPDTLVGNGYTSFPPANTMDFQEQLTRTLSLTTNQGAAL